ncbi:Lrp/AsnC family transcriptional regulator [Kocuria sp. M4R2S49]|uniref:Lrp/AsnC family transcriptional regulator n=1 Tax=Kocuria rhizosphaericola TaxID=3376284 RepID=UPI0037A7C1B1
MAGELDDLQRRIVAALQIDGRASWRRIAAVLDVPERSVARRGAELLAHGAVGIVGIRPQPTHVIVKATCAPGTSMVAVEALARRQDASFAYRVTGGADCVAELLIEPTRLGEILSLEIPAIAGISSTRSYPVLKYFRTIRSWRAEVLSTAQVSALERPRTRDVWPPAVRPSLAAQDEQMLAVLREDGRASYEVIARRAGVSESTARRRVDWLLDQQVMQIRAVVEPALLGLPVEALLWIRAAPRRVDDIGAALGQESCVRYAAAIAGDHQILADVTVGGLGDLYRFITGSRWSQAVEGVEVSVLLGARKRGGRIMPSG